MQSISKKYSMDKSNDYIFKIIRNSDNHIIHTYQQTLGAPPLNRFVIINNNEWWFGGYDCMSKVLVNCDTNDVYTDSFDESDSDSDTDYDEEWCRKRTEREFIWVGPCLVSPNGKYLLMYGCVWGFPYMYELFDISDLPNSYKLLELNKYITYTNINKFSTWVGQHTNMEYKLHDNILDMYYINPKDKTKPKTLVYQATLP